MKRFLVLMLAVGMLVGMLGGTALSQEPPRHPHMLVLGLEVDADEEPVGFRKCVDLAGGRALPLNAHHSTIHTGQAGEALFNAGNAVVPGAPLTPWSNCAELVADVFGE